MRCLFNSPSLHDMPLIHITCSYSEYWRSRLATESITKFAPVVRTNSLSTGKHNFEVKDYKFMNIAVIRVIKYHNLFEI